MWLVWLQHDTEQSRVLTSRFGPCRSGWGRSRYPKLSLLHQNHSPTLVKAKGFFSYFDVAEDMALAILRQRNTKDGPYSQVDGFRLGDWP